MMHIFVYLFSKPFLTKFVYFQGVVMLPNINEFEVLVKRFNSSVFFTKGWKALLDFYGIHIGV